MPKTIQLKIPEPCHENWQQMTPVEQGKFCNACQKTVVDFSLMSDQEILLHISRASGNVCGRLMNDQLDRRINITNESNRFSFKYVWNMILAGFLISSEATAQTKPVQGKVRVENKPASPTELPLIMGIIAHEVAGSVVDDEDGTPIGFATIKVAGKDHAFATDSSGKFNVIRTSMQGNTIIISSIGYEAKIIQLDKILKENISPIIRLQRSVIELGEVTVTGYGTTTCSTVDGGMISVRGMTIVEGITDTIITTFTKNPIKIFPNPVAKGGIINIQFGIKEPGDYHLEIVNTAGQLLRKEVITVQIKNQVKQIFIPEQFAKGVYYIRIANTASQKVYQNKFIIK